MLPFSQYNASKKYKESKRLFTRAKQILPGGVDSPVRAFKAVGGTPLFVRWAKGAYIHDEDGQTYIDYVMSWGPLIHGHAPTGLIRTLTAAAKRGVSFGAPTSLEVKLGSQVKALIPSVERIRFVNSGTEATMSALRVARAATGRDKFVKFSGCYHGHSDSFLVQAGSGAMTLGVPTSPGVTSPTAADTLVASYNDLHSVENLYKTYPGKIAAIIVEPIAGNMGVIPPARGFLEGLRILCNHQKSLLIFDEVISGFRIASGGAQEVMGVRPDLTCLGKVIGGGLPVGAYGGRAELMEQVAPSGAVYQAGTLSGNPLAMTAGLWCLTHLSDKLYQRLARLGTLLAEGLSSAAKNEGVPLQVNRFGSMFTPFFTRKPVYDYHSASEASTASYAKFFRGMLARGIYLPPSQFESWFLSSAHTIRDVEVTIKAAQKVMKFISRS